MAVIIGQLYLKLIEGKNLPAVDGSSSDPLVTLIPNEGPKIKLESKAIPKNLDPIWNEEFLFTLSNRNAVITVDVKHKNKVLKNKAIGQGKLQVAGCPDNQIVEIWLPLPNLKDAQIHLLARFTPFRTNAGARAVNARLPEFRAQLERDIYWSGEVVRGFILYNIGKPKKIRGVRVRFEGFSRAFWNATDYAPGDPSGSNQYESKVYFFNPVATLYGNPRGSRKDFYIQSNTYLWPFEFVLPVNLPPTYRSNYGLNYYGVDCYVDIPWATNKRVKKEFQIFVQYASLRKEPTLRMSKKTKGTIFASNAPLLVAAKTKEIAHLGEPQDVEISVTNQTNKDLKKLKFKLERKGTYYAARPSKTFYAEKQGSWSSDRALAWARSMNSQRKTVDIIINQTLEVVVIPGGTWTGTIRLAIPATISPSLPAILSPIVQCKYLLHVEAETKGNFFTKNSSNISFELMVGQRNPATLANIAPPTAPMGTVHQISVVKVDTVTNQHWNALAPPPILEMPPKDGMGLYGPLPAQIYQQNVYQPEQWYDQGGEDGGGQGAASATAATYQ